MRRNRHLEFALLVVLIMVLAGVVMDRIWQLRFAAERTAVAHTVGALRYATAIQVARNAVGKGLESAALLAGTNPFRFLESLPSNYAGEESEGKPAPGQWRYDPATGECIYRYRFTEGSTSEELRYRITLQYRDVDRTGAYESGSDVLNNVVLARTRQPPEM